MLDVEPKFLIMISRFTGTFAVFAVSFSVFLLFELLAEALDDSLAATAFVALALVDAFAPIGLLMILLPSSIAFLYWLLCPPREALHLIIWHGILVVTAYLAISIGLLAAGYLLYLDGPRNLTSTRIIGNSLLCAIIAISIFLACRKQLTERNSRQGAAVNEAHRGPD